MNLQERYREDPNFHALVHMFYREFEKVEQYRGAGLTPSEIREASGLAWQMYAERNLVPPMMVRQP